MAGGADTPDTQNRASGALNAVDAELPESLDLRAISIRALVRVVTDKSAPAAAVASAARTLAEMSGLIGNRLISQANKPISEMTPDEINAELARLSAAK